ncbi:MAG: hypothetical protein HC773_12630 [Scytonema sp. CRU_2_7]|nr:hypothetical protein [Scytonema sp. CRU_2_7]
MRVWLACFLLLFAIAQLFDWMKGFTLPLPIYILGGAFLAVASNYNKLFGSYLNQTNSETPSQQILLEDSPSFTISQPVENWQNLK